jgi:hypothetical protein
MLWTAAVAIALVVALILASKAIRWLRHRKDPQQEDGQWIGSGICRVCGEELLEAPEGRVEAWYADHNARHG